MFAAAGIALLPAPPTALGEDTTLGEFPTAKRFVEPLSATPLPAAEETSQLKWRPRKAAPASDAPRLIDQVVQPAQATQPAPRRTITATPVQSRFSQPDTPPALEPATGGVEDLFGSQPAVPSEVGENNFQPLDVPAADPGVDLRPDTTLPLGGGLPDGFSPLPEPPAAPKDLADPLERPLDRDSLFLQENPPTAKKQSNCGQKYRDADCCTQAEACARAWSQVRKNELHTFDRQFLDITPLYKPDIRYAGEEEVDQDKATALGMAVSALRSWHNAAGHVLGVLDGKLYGGDGEDWEAQWQREADDADAASLPRPEKPAPLKASVATFVAGSATVTLRAESGDQFTVEVSNLSADDRYWLGGRPWRDSQGEVIAHGRLREYEWGRVVIATASGQLVQIPVQKLGADELCYLNAYWGEGLGLPPACRIEGTMRIRNFVMTGFHWKASGLCHKPLYFEEVALERYGHSHGPLAQPVISGAHFFANVAILPYKMGIHSPHECIYALGYYRPGDCAPYQIGPFPFSVRGGLFQAGAVVGAVALFP
ncbi:MAG: hypothetical protein KDA41_09035 [Planctomycetales bacterium]|nr:hypothetical protein [Planctomycetales bacterium]